MKIGLLAVDSRYPNLALMKIAKWHKLRADIVEWYDGMSRYDKVYAAKVFTFTPDYGYYINAGCVERGGTGYDIHKTLPIEIDRMQPDYSIYQQIDGKTAYGFLTRGCPNKCRWCIVPQKEGNVRPYMDVDEIAIDGRTNLVLMDNNILASNYGLTQIDKIISKRYRVDFNQALDARLVDDYVANMLAHVKWLAPIRFGCDTVAQVAKCERAMKLIDTYRGAPMQYLLYTIIIGDIGECYRRVSHFRGNKRVRIVAQPFRDYGNPRQAIPQWQKDMARWSMRRELYASCDFMDFEPRKGFKCEQYFNE